MVVLTVGAPPTSHRRRLVARPGRHKRARSPDPLGLKSGSRRTRGNARFLILSRLSGKVSQLSIGTDVKD